MVFDVWHEAVDLYVLKFQSVNIRKSGKVAQVEVAEWLRDEPTASLFHPEYFDEMQ